MAHFRAQYETAPDVTTLGAMIFEHCSNEPNGSHIDLTLEIGSYQGIHNILCGAVSLDAARSYAQEMLTAYNKSIQAAAPPTNVAPTAL
jgi:hypothetical protein